MLPNEEMKDAWNKTGLITIQNETLKQYLIINDKMKLTFRLLSKW